MYVSVEVSRLIRVSLGTLKRAVAADSMARTAHSGEPMPWSERPRNDWDVANRWRTREARGQVCQKQISAYVHAC